MVGFTMDAVLAQEDRDHERKRVPLILSKAEWRWLKANAVRHGTSLGVAASVAIANAHRTENDGRSG